MRVLLKNLAFMREVGFTSVIFFALFLVSVFLYFSPSLRSPFREYFAPPERKILSVAEGQVIPGETSRVLKVQTPDGIFIEVYGHIEKGVTPLIQKIKLPDRRDAHFQFQGRATNLALKDLDGGNVFEIIAPTYDASTIPHLNIYKYNVEAKSFAPYEK